MQNKNGVSFRRIGGRIVPIKVKREAGAIAATGREVAKPSNLGLIGKAAAITAGGLGLAFGAGKLKTLSTLFQHTKKAAYMERGAKFLDYGAKAGVGVAAGTQLTRLDRQTRKDEGSKLLNFGSQGVGAIGLASSLVLGYGSYRLTKRFTKWGLKGGAFPWKLSDI